MSARKGWHVSEYGMIRRSPGLVARVARGWTRYGVALEQVGLGTLQSARDLLTWALGIGTSTWPQNATREWLDNGAAHTVRWDGSNTAGHEL